MSVEILTAGYEGRTVQEFVELLRKHRVQVVIDVRLTPISRKKGFSKSDLSRALEAADIRYRHERGLGNPKHIRTEATSVEECLKLYRMYMEDRWGNALSPVMDEIRSERVCLLCMERLSGYCHRSIVARELVKRLPDAVVKNI